MKNRRLFALDLGSAKLCLATERPEGFRKIVVESQGIVRGQIADFALARSALIRLIEVAEAELSEDVFRVFVNIAGSGLRTEEIEESLPLRDNDPIQGQHLVELYNRVAQKSHETGVDVITHSPLRYRVDRRNWIDNPTGFTGRVLTARFLTISSDHRYLCDLIRLCNQSGLEVAGTYVSALASAAACDLPDEPTLLLDAGAGKTDGVLLQGGRPLHHFTIDVGGILVTRDLAVGLRIPFDEAERFKILYGSLDAAAIREGPIDHRLARQVVTSRVGEMAQLVENRLAAWPQVPPSAIVLTGGSSEMAGIEAVFQRTLGVPVRRGLPQARCGESKELSPKLATAAGLLELGRRAGEGTAAQGPSRSFGSYLRRFSSWVREL